jgi:hypothetical protein
VNKIYLFIILGCLIIIGGGVLILISTNINDSELSACDKLGPIERYACYSKVAFARKDLSACEKVVDETYQPSCYYSVAVAKQDLSMCDTLGTDSRSFCYRDIAVLNQDLSLCDKIQVPTLKDDCYNSIGTAKQDSGICTKIKSAYYRNDCLEKITAPNFIKSCNIASTTMDESWYNDFCKQEAKNILIDKETGLPKQILSSTDFQLFLTNNKPSRLIPFKASYTSGYAGFYPLTQYKAEENERYWTQNGKPKFFTSQETGQLLKTYYSPKNRWVTQIFPDSPDSFIELWDMQIKCHSRVSQCGTLCNHEGFTWLNENTLTFWGESYESYNVSTAMYNKYVTITQIYPSVGVCQNEYLSQQIANNP